MIVALKQSNGEYSTATVNYRIDISVVEYTVKKDVQCSLSIRKVNIVLSFEKNSNSFRPKRSG